MIDRSLVHSATGIGYYSTSTSASGEGKGEGLIWVYAFFDSTTVEVLLYLHSSATFGVLMIKSIMLSCWSGLVWSGLCTPVHTVRVHVHTYSVWAFERVAPHFRSRCPKMRQVASLGVLSVNSAVMYLGQGALCMIQRALACICYRLLDYG